MSTALSVQCKAISKGSGQRCKRRAIPGGEVCRWHGGAAKQVKAKAAIRAEVMNWGLGDSHVDPGEVLLRLVSQSAARAEMYAKELKVLVDESPTLREALVAEVWVPTESGEAYQAGEYIRGLAKLEAEERDRCAGFATKAVAAGIAERQVRIAEAQAQILAGVVRAVLDRLQLSEEQQALAPVALREELMAVTG
jgi:hypothetical protein